MFEHVGWSYDSGQCHVPRENQARAKILVYIDRCREGERESREKDIQIERDMYIRSHTFI